MAFAGAADGSETHFAIQEPISEANHIGIVILGLVARFCSSVWDVESLPLLGQPSFIHEIHRRKVEGA
jgi:hypothetical protein